MGAASSSSSATPPLSTATNRATNGHAVPHPAARGGAETAAGFPAAGVWWSIGPGPGDGGGGGGDRAGSTIYFHGKTGALRNAMPTGATPDTATIVRRAPPALYTAVSALAAAIPAIPAGDGGDRNTPDDRPHNHPLVGSSLPEAHSPCEFGTPTRVSVLSFPLSLYPVVCSFTQPSRSDRADCRAGCSTLRRWAEVQPQNRIAA